MANKLVRTHHDTSDCPRFLKEWPFRRIILELFTLDEQTELVSEWWSVYREDPDTLRLLARVYKMRPDRMAEKTDEEMTALFRAGITDHSCQDFYKELAGISMRDLENCNAKLFFQLCFQNEITHLPDADSWSIVPLPTYKMMVDIFCGPSFHDVPARVTARLFLGILHAPAVGTSPHVAQYEPILTALTSHIHEPTGKVLATQQSPDPQPGYWYRFLPRTMTKPVAFTRLERYLSQRQDRSDAYKDALLSLQQDYDTPRPSVSFLLGRYDVSALTELDPATPSHAYWTGVFWQGVYKKLLAPCTTILDHHPALVIRWVRLVTEPERGLAAYLVCTLLNTERYGLAIDCLQPWILQLLGPRAACALITLLHTIRRTHPQPARVLATLLADYMATRPTEEHGSHRRTLESLQELFAQEDRPQPVEETPSAPASDTIPVVPPQPSSWAVPIEIGSVRTWPDLVLPATHQPHGLSDARLPKDEEAHSLTAAYRALLLAIMDGTSASLYADCLSLKRRILESGHARTLVTWTDHLTLYAGLSSLAELDEQSCSRGMEQLNALPADRPIVLPKWLLEKRAKALVEIESPGAAPFLDWLTNHGVDEVTLPYRTALIWLMASANAKERLAERVADQHRTQLQRWEDALVLLRVGIATEHKSSMEGAIAALITIGMTPTFQSRLLELLSHPDNYDPALDYEESTSLRIQILEQQNRYTEAITLIRPRFHAAVTNEEWDDAAAYLTQLKGYPDVKGIIQPEIDRWQAVQGAVDRTPETTTINPRLTEPMTILYIGGDEHQERYDQFLKQHFAQYPSVTLETIFPGWVMQWNDFLARNREAIKRADCMVILTHMRTDLHRNLRKAADDIGKNLWVSCTNTGRGGIRLSIEKAIALVQKRRQERS